MPDYTEVLPRAMWRLCTGCNTRLSLDHFSFRLNKRGVRRQKSRCNDCQKDRQFRHRYGITREDFDKLTREQHGLCAICKKPEPRYKYLSVDHDHETSKVRGLLCSLCNPMIGYAKESIVTLESAITYLQKEH